MTRARDVALTVLTRVEDGGAYAAAVLDSELKTVKDSREAAFATELVLGVLRNRPFLDQLLEKASDRGLERLDPVVRRILRLGVYQIAFLDKIPSRAAVSEAVEQVRRSRARGLSKLANALLRRISRMDKGELSPDTADSEADLKSAAIQLGIPNWLLTRLVDNWGRQGAFAMARAFNKPSRRTLRLNLKGAGREEFLKTAANGRARPGTVGLLTPWSLDVSDRSVSAELVESGRAAFQDEGAQLVALAVAPTAGDTILDACAGRGGKTAALASMVQGEAEIIAVDRSTSKLERLVFELGRQGYSAGTLTADIINAPQSINRQFSKVLLDAPCSGTGTIGRRPEIRWRLDTESVKSLTEVQSRMLNTAANFVAPGGRLVYAVCSVLKEEGISHGLSFLEQHGDFHPVLVAPDEWPEQIPWSRGAIFIDPASTETDGYQILVFEKK